MSRHRQPRPEPKPWKYNWRNPDMVICTRIFEEGLPGMWEKKAVEMTPDEYQQLCQESMNTSTNPTWDRDKTYF